jgi:FkbM family methyltransferase
MKLAPERPPISHTQPRSTVSNANRAVINALARARSAAVNSRLPLFRPLAVLGQAQTIAERKVRGVSMRMLIEDYCDYAVFKSWETVEPHTLDWIDGFPARASFLDIGSSIGRFSLYAARRHPRLAVAAVDPDARVSHRLARSSASNGCGDRITQLLLGASDADGHDRMVFNYRIQQGHLGGAHITERETFAYTVETMRIDTIVERQLIEPPTHIKIDVDGHEVAVVRGAERTLRAPQLQSVLIEVDDDTASPVEVLMRAAGLREASRAQLSSGLVNVVYEREM